MFPARVLSRSGLPSLPGLSNRRNRPIRHMTAVQQAAHHFRFMQRPSEPSTSPLPSERLRVGDCVVDVPLREIRAPGKRRPLRITPKSMGVLLVLVDQAGRVVSRDALMTEVWPDTLPTDDVVTQAITQLRKAFDDERGNPRYIETIAKYGYRLLAPVEWLEEGGLSQEGHSQAAPRPAAGNGGAAPAIAMSPRYPQSPVDVRGDWRMIAIALGAAALAFVLVLLWSLRADRTPQAAVRAGQTGLAAPSANYRLITSVP